MLHNNLEILDRRTTSAGRRRATGTWAGLLFMVAALLLSSCNTAPQAVELTPPQTPAAPTVMTQPPPATANLVAAPTAPAQPTAAPAQLTALPTPEPVPTTAAPIPAAQPEVALLDPDGTVVLTHGQDRIPLTKLSIAPTASDLSGEQVKLVWSPDGFRLALPDGVWTFGDDPSLARAHAPLQASGYRWSPDGRQLAWIAAVDEHADALLLGGPDGDGASLLAREHWGFTGPTAWSPDGRLVIAGQRMQTALSGGDLASLPAERGHNATWSPDGRQLAWTQSDGDNLTLTTTVVLATDDRQTTLATLHFALSEPFQGEARRYDQAQPTWLPDGSGLLLAAQTNAAQSAGTWLVRLDGTATRLSPHTLCDLAPDGQRMLARTQAGLIVVVKLADGTIESEIGPGETAAWRPPHSGAAPAAPLAAKSPQLALATPPIQGEAVRELQQQLKELGYDPGASDGIYGEQTAGAVRRFQQAMGLDVDGVVGPQTWSWLRAQMWRLR
jgi:hypothetical protein